MSYSLKTTRQFDKDVKLAKKRNLNIEKLLDVVGKLVNEEPLPAKNKDHMLTGNYAGCRECHIEPDWLLIYEKEETIRLITLIRTGTHSAYFKNT